jgi:hypothetical protein
MKLEKPDFLPFTGLPIPIYQSLEAGRYIFSLEVKEGPLEDDQVYRILLGTEMPVDRNMHPDKVRIARQVFQVIGRQSPPLRKYNPHKILLSLERA